MTAPTIDRDAIIEKAAQIHNDTFEGGMLWTQWAEFVATHDRAEVDPEARIIWDIVDDGRKCMGAALPSIADDLLAPIEAIHQRVPLHNPEDECECGNRDTHEIGYDEWGDPICLSEEPINWVCAECYRDDGETGEWPCLTAKAVAAIREAVRA